MSNMKLVVATVSLLVLLSAASEGKKVVCYYSSWAVYRDGNYAVRPEDIDATLCTHLNYAFIAIAEDGSLHPADDWADVQNNGYARTVALKQRNPNLKVLLSVGGGSASPDTFSAIASDPSKRSTLVNSAKYFMQTYGFDGIDIDWEVPKSADKANFISLIQDLKNNFNQNGWEVTAAVAAYTLDGYDVPRMSEILDHINVMTYDFYGPWSEYTGQNSPLYASSIESDWQKQNLNMDAGIRIWRNAGASPSKLIAGIAFYGHSFTLQDPNNNGLHAPISGADEGGPITKSPGSWCYFEFCADQSWQCHWDSQQDVSICTKGNQWLGTDNEQSIRDKVAYINSNDLGGAMVWSIDQDDFQGNCGRANILLHTVKDNLN